MSKRYGRNQRRKNKARIEQLEKLLERETARSVWAEARLQNSRSLAFQDFLKHGDLLKRSLETIAKNIGIAVGKDLEPAARQLFQASIERDDMPFSAEIGERQLDKCVTVLTGSVKPQYYSIAMTDLDFFLDGGN